jgi:small subunit ribosomal protein S27Ae
MQIYVRDLEGLTHGVTCEEWTVADLKAHVAELTGVPEEDQRLVYGGSCLDDESSVQDVLEEEATVFLTSGLDGGAKKRKKKVYTKPKKIPHKHKKVKLAVLKYYKVDGNGKVVRLRKESPVCGPGVFMATHFNRYHCGKSGVTYLFDKDGKAAVA